MFDSAVQRFPLIKPFQIQNAFLVAQLQKQGTALDMEERLLHSRSPLRSALLAQLFPAMPSVATYILHTDDEKHPQTGLVQARIRLGRPEQEVIFLSPSLESGNGSHAMWQRLLNHLCVKAGEMGHQRIYARLSSDSTDVQVFRNVGFTPYAEERIFRLDAELYPETPSDGLGLRPQTTADSWSVQRLYTAVTPHTVQVAEGLAQGQWQVNNYLLANQGSHYGFVWENRGEILAVLNVHSGKAGHWLRLMIHPDVQNETTRFILGGLNRLKNPRKQPVYFSLRTYQSELVANLLACGFREQGNQQVLVKHITIRAKDFLSRLLPVFDTPAAEGNHAAPVMQSKSSTPKTNGRH